MNLGVTVQSWTVHYAARLQAGTVLGAFFFGTKDRYITVVFTIGMGYNNVMKAVKRTLID